MIFFAKFVSDLGIGWYKLSIIGQYVGNIIMERVNRRILYSLQKDSTLSVSEIGERVGLSTSACHRRIRQLEEEGVIEGYSATLSRTALGYSIEVFVEVTLSGQSEALLDQFEKAATECNDIIECHLMAGDADYLLRVAAENPESYEYLHRKVLASLPGVARLKSNLVLKSVKPYSGYPVKQI